MKLITCALSGRATCDPVMICDDAGDDLFSPHVFDKQVAEAHLHRHTDRATGRCQVLDRTVEGVVKLIREDSRRMLAQAYYAAIGPAPAPAPSPRAGQPHASRTSRTW